MVSDAEKIAKALEIAAEDGQVDGGHHKMWVIDQMVRALTGCPMVEKTARSSYQGEPYAYMTQGESPEYEAFVAAYGDGGWDEGIAP